MNIANSAITKQLRFVAMCKHTRRKLLEAKQNFFNRNPDVLVDSTTFF